jgi:hypothetical protein
VEGSRSGGEEGGEIRVVGQGWEWGKGGEEVEGLGKGCPVRFYSGQSRVLC